MAASANGPDAELKLSADIGPRPVTAALAAFGRQTGLQLIYVSTIAESQQSKGSRAGVTAREALTQLLDGTGLTFEFLNARTVRIFPRPVLAPPTVARLPASQQAPQHTTLALEPVIVTATRRAEAVNNVPVDMAVWTADAMRASGIKGMSELASLTPAMQFQTIGDLGGSGVSYLSMRGVAGRNASTTGLYLDDTPIPPAAGDTVLSSFPFTFDLDRVEILRGPQLQLFGEGNEGGAVRFIFNQPSLSTFTGLASAELAMTNGSSMTYEAGGALGGPVIHDLLGFRISAWARTEGGYVDRVDPFTDAVVESNANRSQSTSLRGAMTLAPSDAVQITPSLTYTSYKVHDTSYFFTNLSDVSSARLRNGSLLRQPSDQTFYLGALKLAADLSVAHFSAVSSYFDRKIDLLLDGTNAFDWNNPLGPGYPLDYADAAATQWTIQQRMFMQELRLTSPDHGTALTWDAGAFYSTHNVRWAEHWTAANGLPGIAPAPADLKQVAAGTQTRLAAFAEVSLAITKQLTVSGGLHSERTHYAATNELPAIPPATGAGSGLMPRLRVSYQTDEDELFYLNVSKGYGSSGSAPGEITCNETAGVFGTDTLWSYEVGTKSIALDGRLQLDTGVFHMVWHNGPGYADLCTLPGSPGAAASNGFDLAAQMLPSAHIKLSANLAYTDARYTETLTQNGVATVRRGDAVGASNDFAAIAPWNITASIDYLVLVGRDVNCNLRVEDIFRSRNPGPFAVQNPDSAYYIPDWRADPSTNLINLRASLRWERYEATLFVNNALNALPTLHTVNVIGQATPLLFATTFRPRTLGLAASWHF